MKSLIGLKSVFQNVILAERKTSLTGPVDQATSISSLQVFRHSVGENSKSKSQLKIDAAYYY